ncbi:hypothetical protein AAFC00_006369 [Neodothiora populina]|uniref:DUF3835 domain-containing protein n=1 Tax=Neodothiora populina TaxID=2781224 RepID=A0ABR3P4Y3_9PEZI
MSSLDQLELQRLQLEETVAQLRKSLQHWRTWDAEYEGLKEELMRSNSVRSAQDCTRLSDNLGGELVNEQEIRELYNVGKGQIRSNDQVSSLIDRRQDYVQQNINTISKRLRSSEDRLEQIIEEQNQGDDQGEQGLPLTEILEELDDDGNVISSKISQPESATAQIVETLRKVGLADLDPDQRESVSAQDTLKTASSNNSKATVAPSSSIPQTTEQSKPKGSKKSVKFQDVEDEASNSDDKPAPAVKSVAPTPNPSLIAGSFNSNDRIIELDDDDEMIGMTPVIPEDEAPEDAQTRREMLQYSLNEVGSVVAELDLDEGFSDDDDDDDDEIDLDDLASNSEVSEDEDEHGRSLHKGVKKGYRQQMLELEERLMARMLENVGPEPDETNPFIDPEELRKVVVKADSEMPSSKQSTSSSKKGVRFADDLDIQDPPSAGQQQQKPANETVVAPQIESPISDSVLERKPAISASAQPEKKNGRVSRSKQARAEQTPSTDGSDIKPEARPILSNSVVERPVAPSSASAPDTKDELDPEIQQRQLTSEYYRMRNNLIRQQGGFKMTDENGEMMEETADGKVKKVSMFKAARLR